MIIPGNVGIGTASPGTKLELCGIPGEPPLSGTTTTGQLRFTNTTDTGSIQMGVRGSGAGAWLQSNDIANQAATYPLLLNPTGGNVGIGTTNPLGNLHVRGTAAAGAAVARYSSGPVGADSVTIYANFLDYNSGTAMGNIIRTGTNSVAYQTTSDARLKDAITDSNRGLDALLAIKVSDYKMGETSQQGLLAQQVAEHYPECVHEGGEDPNLEPWMIDYGRLTPLIIKAFQDLKAEFDAFKAAALPVVGH
jgi:hypothetical protein